MPQRWLKTMNSALHQALKRFMKMLSGTFMMVRTATNSVSEVPLKYQQ
jgi:hypothetical protein